MKVFSFMMAGVLLLAGAAQAQEDVTARYLTNPSFEADNPANLSAVNNSADGLRGYTLAQPAGWTVSGTSVTQLLVAADCYTDNNFGKVTTVADGSYAYYLRMGWSGGNTVVAQAVTLPAGTYRFSACLRSAYANSAASSFTLTATAEDVSVAGSSTTFSSGSNGVFTSMAWQEASLVFTIKEALPVTLGVNINWLSGGSCIMLDKVTLATVDDGNAQVLDPNMEEPTETSVASFTEGVITGDFVPEARMKADLLQMLADFSKYMVNDWQEAQYPNSIGESCGCFKGENTMGNNEQGVRPNADLSMICAFLLKYGQPAGVQLPAGVTWAKIEDMAMKSLVFAYSTHKANKLKVCAGGNYWGSVSNSDHVWESSLWAMSVAYSAYFQWEKLSDAQKGYIYSLLKAECNYELERSIPTGYNGDTKAEENGWEADILAATLGLYPDDPLAGKWFDRLREFAINSYSHSSDARNTTVIDPWYDQKTVADLYKGQNLYDDYSLQNHNLFHTSYQNVVMQELGEAALALKMFQQGLYGEEKWKTNALMHNNQQVQDSILNWLALADGELAMPNGNDWSLFLYDQITSYTTQACFQQDVNALLLENMAYKYIQARQKTTADGSWLLRADVGARRMGVEAHRVMMTYLMHDVLSTADLTPKTWAQFNAEFSEARMIPCQNIVRAATDSRFTCFSWSTGLKSYTGYFASNSPDKNKIVVPYRANNTGNLTGWYEVSGKGTNATPVVSGNYQLQGNGYVMNGELNTNDNTLNNRFVLYSTPQNALIYLDYVTANAAATITAEKGGLLAISTDELMKTSRTLYYNKAESAITHKQTDGSAFVSVQSDWVNIDNELGIVGKNGKKVAFGDRSANNSIYTSKLYPMYGGESRTVAKGDVVDARHLAYYSLVDAVETQRLAQLITPLRSLLPEGWNGVIAPDADRAHFLLSNFKGTASQATVSGIQYDDAAPVFYQPTTITDNTAAATFTVKQNNSVAQPVRVLVKGTDVEAQLENDTTATLTATATTTVAVTITVGGQSRPATREGIKIKAGKTVKVYLKDSEVCVQGASPFDVDSDGDVTLADITEMIAIYLGKAGASDMGDIDGDGEITLADITMLIDHYLGIAQ